jgi:hypothetical protein
MNIVIAAHVSAFHGWDHSSIDGIHATVEESALSMDGLIDPLESVHVINDGADLIYGELPLSMAIVHDTNVEVHITDGESHPSMAVVHDTNVEVRITHG